MSEETEKQIKIVCDNLADFLIMKNRNYGDSALKPINVFSKNSPEGALLVRLDDKLSRIQNSPDLKKNDLTDAIGYEILLCIKNNWLEFDDLVD